MKYPFLHYFPSIYISLIRQPKGIGHSFAFADPIISPQFCIRSIPREQKIRPHTFDSLIIHLY